MIVEEKKAADCICPQMISATPEYRWCQGSRCMAWRWVDDAKHEHKTHGFCGLAGRP